MVQWVRVKPLEDSESIDRLEKQYQFALSPALKTCIQNYNGGRPRPNTVRLANGQENDVKMLLSYNQADIETVYRVLPFFIDLFHGSVIPFATDSAGNYYCERAGEILLWIQGEEKLYPVCGGFSAFLDAFYEL